MTEDRRDIRDWLVRADRGSDWSGITATVLGLGRSGFAAADVLLRVGAVVTVVDQLESADQRERATVLDALGATVLLGRSEPPAGRIDLLDAAGEDYVVNAESYRSRSFLLFNAERIGAHFYVPVERAEACRALLRERAFSVIEAGELDA